LIRKPVNIWGKLAGQIIFVIRRHRAFPALCHINIILRNAGDARAVLIIVGHKEVMKITKMAELPS